MRVAIIRLTTILLLFTIKAKANSISEESISNVNLAPFSIELRSKKKSKTGNYLAELEQTTLNHLNDFFRGEPMDSSGEFYNFVNASLKVTGFSSEVQAGKRTLRRNLQSNFISSVSYVGFLQFSGDSVPEEEFIRDLQLQAFIGQAKLHYLNQLEPSSDHFLSSTNDVIISFEVKVSEQKENKFGDDSLLVYIIVGTTIGVVVLGTITAVVCLCRKRPEVDRREKAMRLRKRKEMEKKMANELKKSSAVPDLQIVSTGSLSASSSPSGLSQDSSRFTFNPMLEGGSTSTGTKTGKKSTTSTGTIDLKANSVDLLAWKGKGFSNVTFDADITMITNNSPNKTLEIDPNPNDVKPKQKKPSHQRSNSDGTYLSKDTLSRFNEKKGFVAHSERYHERVHGKRVGRGMRASGNVDRDRDEVINDLKNLSAQFKNHRQLS